MATILFGKPIQEKMKERLVERVKALSFAASLAIIQIGNLSDSNTYVRQKKLLGEKIGVSVVHHALPKEVKIEEIKMLIQSLNNDKSVHGVILQLPLPPSLDSSELLDTISPRKDADALTSYHVKRLLEGNKKTLLPATARGVLALLDAYNISVSGKRVVVVGRSALVGKPIALALLNRDATVTICHSKTTNLDDITKTADIVIVAIGKPRFFTRNFFREGQVVVDVGINEAPGSKLEEEIGGRMLVGDVYFEEVKGVVSAISPTPGGVGPMTVASLFENLLDLIEANQA
ncbi:MAG: hypothetical protein A2836_03840 [Candidatus Taylorbacteria bacterium RIFCSPHIGHO2_01_FULL_45_63]|uniref:Bifunctional protein FolD n=1 Tax=Candidatus Taylorbacteria bacterium RIFCSPHIGHO2_02_FULL_45_35 TaxID=1802311 RepID=A0A1G2MPN7_9BACT|nr:MAG: hypothetical protein A2836_03840 [Candidatus Taylorbacteria bacterium RIFCSPHIGHO2_01_FULL_45_63]OHA25845.1 MAG: hypothetical protein A3D56_00960 [Candidatus Taylorbacteria bacterium RIFCSPHIGHO2_02_FULL_45_35]OHA34357.1 MAG: hypothetical protein A3A22_00540 [Candidatus Taylorbacteria bacterium RIFCSPLOWO2_01_FULL_45_34b]